MSSLLTLVSASGLLAAALKSALVVLVAAVVAALLGRASAAWRHLAWSLSVASLLLLPVLSLALPDWRVVRLPSWTAESSQLAATGQTHLAHAGSTEPLDDAASGLPSAAARASETEPRQALHNPPPGATETTSSSRSATSWVNVLWAAGGLLSLVPLAVGLWQLAGLRRCSQVVGDHRWLTLLAELCRQLALRRRVQLRQSESALAPLTWGALRPVVLVPCEAGAWPDKRRRLVLLHELAHVRRWDWLAQLLAHVACAVYWFNPLVWLAARQMRIERERACDDIVLSSGARASDYAQELLSLAAGLSRSQPSMLAAVPMARRRELETRVRGILDSRRPRATPTKPAVCLGAALAAAILAPLAMLQAAPPEAPQAPPVVPLSKLDLA
jgi:beta-lactamase regulating signal transducer with metallopeptidase domain